MIPIELLMIPNFIGFKKFGIINTYQSQIIPILLSGFMTLIYLLYYKTIKRKEGESISFNTIWKKAKIAIIINIFFVFYAVINSFMWPLMSINSMEMKTISVGIASLQGMYTSSYPLLSAGIILHLIPIFIIYVILSFLFIKALRSYNIKN